MNSALVDVLMHYTSVARICLFVAVLWLWLLAGV